MFFGNSESPQAAGELWCRSGVEDRTGVLWPMYRAQLIRVLNIDAGRRLNTPNIACKRTTLVDLPQFDSRCLAYVLDGWGPSKAFEPEQVEMCLR